MSSPSSKAMLRANTVITSFAPSPRLLLNERSSPVMCRQPVSPIGTASSSDCRATTFILSTAPESRRVSMGKMKNRSPRLMCENTGAAASTPRSSARFLILTSSMPLPPYRRMPHSRGGRAAPHLYGS